MQLRDDRVEREAQPTRIKILEHGFDWLLKDLHGARATVLFFYFSGARASLTSNSKPVTFSPSLLFPYPSS